MSLESSSFVGVIKRVRANLAVLLGSAGVATFLGFCTVAINARSIGAEGVGVIALFQSSAALLVGLFSFGTQQPLIKLGRQAIEEGRKSDVGSILLLGFVIDTLAAIAAGVVALIVVSFGAKYVGISQEYIELAKLYTVVIFLSGVASTNGVFRLLYRFHFVGAFQVFVSLLLFFSSCALFYFSSPLYWYVYAYAFVYSFGSILQVLAAFWLIKKSGFSFFGNLGVLGRPGFLSDFFSYIWTTNATGTINTLRANLDVLLLGFFFDSATSGIYSVVRQLAGVMNKITSAISIVVFPEVSLLAAKRDFAASFRLLKSLAVGGLFLGGLAVMIAAIFGEHVLAIGFGLQFRSGGAALNFLVFSSAIMMSAAAFGGFVQVYISPRALLNVYVFAFVAYVLVLFPAAYFAGLDGVAAGQLAFSLVVWFGCCIPLFYRLQSLMKHVDSQKEMPVISQNNEGLNDER